MTKAFAYLRVSGKGQLDGDGFDRQRLAIHKYCSDNNIEIVQEFQEKAVPGKTEWTDRAAWTDMMLVLNGVTTVIIESLNRLARDLMVQEHIVADLRQRNVTLISVAEPDLCVDDPTRKLLRQIMGAIAEYDKAMIVIKLRGARGRAKARDGHCEGRKPYGQKDGEGQWLEHMRNLRSGGMHFDGIAQDLNNTGSTTRYGKKWIGATVCQILGRDKCK